MNAAFTEMIAFQVKPDRISEFEALASGIKSEQALQPGCTGVHWFKRFYTFDGVELGAPPRELTRIVKCVKYYCCWEFSNIEDCGRANGWFFRKYLKETSRLLITPFEISSGYSI